MQQRNLTNTNERQHLKDDLVSICRQYMNDYYFMRNRHHYAAAEIMRWIIYLDQYQFNSLKLTERKFYKKLFVGCVILALNQLLRKQPDIKLKANLSKITEEHSDSLFDMNATTDINSDAICQLTGMLMQANQEPRLEKFILIFQSHLDGYAKLYPGKFIAISDVPELPLLNIFTYLSLDERLNFGKTSRYFFSIFNDNSLCKLWLLEKGLELDEITTLNKLYQRRENGLLFLMQQMQKMQKGKGRHAFNKAISALLAESSCFGIGYSVDDFSVIFANGGHIVDLCVPRMDHLNKLWRSVEDDYRSVKHDGIIGSIFKRSYPHYIKKRQDHLFDYLMKHSVSLKEEKRSIIKLLCDYTKKHIYLFNLYLEVTNQKDESNFAEINWDDIYVGMSSALVDMKRIIDESNTSKCVRRI